MSQPMIEVKDVTKLFRFRSDRPNSLKTILVNLLRGRINLGKVSEFFALQNVSFEIQQGEFVGIMGRNGAGKSTLLKLISGIYTPTTGSISINGTIAPLIELGAGFHPELTGYENVFLNASILGYGRKAANDKLQEIVDFAELGEKIYMPIKNYSSGMLVRLGFSIATHLPAPILLIDEILAVGDVAFQQKCLAKIDSLHREGRTIILITHDPDTVAARCTRCIVIEATKKIFDGNTHSGVQVYRDLFKS